jgi:hypothetical protein
MHHYAIVFLSAIPVAGKKVKAGNSQELVEHEAFY